MNLIVHCIYRKGDNAADNRPLQGANIEDKMSRTQLLSKYTIRQLRIYGRKSGVNILQKWRKPELIAAIVKAGK